MLKKVYEACSSVLSACIASIRSRGGKNSGKGREGEESMFIHTNKYINVFKR